MKTVLRFLFWVTLALLLPLVEGSLLGQQGPPPVMRGASTRNNQPLNPTLPWISEYSAPFIYQVWWKEIADCEGLPLPQEKMRKVQYFQVNAQDFVPYDVDFIVYAVTYEQGQTYIAYPLIWNRSIVEHEAIHLLRKWAGDPKWWDHSPLFYGNTCGIPASGEPPPNA